MTPRPYVFVNMAATADGKIDTVERVGARISGPADTVRVDRLRASADAIMVGGRTLFDEDPRLTVRDPVLQAERQRDGLRAQPAKIGVVSHIGEDPDRSTLGAQSRFLRDGGGAVFICTSARTTPQAARQLEDQGVEVIVRGEQRVDLEACLGALSELGMERIMVEGGSTLVASLLAARLVDEIQLAIAPLIFGGDSAPTAVGGPGWPAHEALELRLAEMSSDDDGAVILRYLLKAGES